mgnify:CR=1 FL=1
MTVPGSKSIANRALVCAALADGPSVLHGVAPGDDTAAMLDVLDAQNTRYNVQAQAETARLAKLYAQYRLLAASNKLIEALPMTTRSGFMRSGTAQPSRRNSGLETTL